MLALTSCKATNNMSLVNNSNNSKVENVQATINALQFIPNNFIEALEIETKRQNILINGCRAEQDNATYQAFLEMKELFDVYCNRVKNKLDKNQLELFENFLLTQKKYNIYFDMLSHNSLQHCVYTNGNASCNEDYNIMRTQTIIMHQYFNYINNTIDENYQKVVDKNFEEFFFFNSDLDYIKGKSMEELESICFEFSPKLKNLFDINLQSLFDDYLVSFNEFISVLQNFETSIYHSNEVIDNSVFYHRVKSAFIYNLYNSIENIEHPEEIKQNINLYIDKENYILKWN